LGTGPNGCNGAACPSGAVYAERYAARVPVSLPTIDLNTQYARANWSAATCIGTNPFDNNATRNSSRGTTSLIGASYDCTARDGAGNFVGRLAWNSSATTWNGIPAKTLFVSGAVFIDGSFGGRPEFQYTTGPLGGTIYFNGTINLKDTKICGPGSGLSGSGCGGTWEPANGALLMVAGNSSGAGNAIDGAANGTEIEAGLWGVGSIDVTSHPIFAGSVYLDNGIGDFTGGGGMQAFVNLPAGAPTGGQYELDANSFDHSGG
jgi:hypothetical protein